MGMPLGDVTLEGVDRLKKELLSRRSGHQYATLLRMFYSRAERAAKRAHKDKLARLYDEGHDDFFVKKQEHALRRDDILTPEEVKRRRAISIR